MNLLALAVELKFGWFNGVPLSQFWIQQTEFTLNIWSNIRWIASKCPGSYNLCVRKKVKCSRKCFTKNRLVRIRFNSDAIYHNSVPALTPSSRPSFSMQNKNVLFPIHIAMNILHSTRHSTNRSVSFLAFGWRRWHQTDA